MKKEMSLNADEQSAGSELKPELRDGEAMLASAELGLLKLASPELERLIAQSTTPTPPQFPYSNVNKPVSEEQEFAEGFVKALEDLHKQNQLNGAGALGGRLLTSSAGLDLPVYTNLSTYGTTVNYSTDTIPFPPPPHQPPPPPPPAPSAEPLKDEPQTVPDVQSFGESPPLSPIDMDTQERIKAERKKLRNRIAASKCRKRKLERISRLEDKVKTLKSQNTELASTASVLREQVAQLKQRVLNHVNNGCQLLPTQVQAY
ncbi:transcription factor JunD-like [Hoplias malabaricus]|uniref:transcription factor JunD-like n=1 Tax=Hoplias malabaricus TaxID=27720 RepID=UPI003461FA4C